MQQTIARHVNLLGTGLHFGRPARLCVKPAASGFGIKFKRTDVADRNNIIPARWDAVTDTVLNTRISNSDGVEVSTIEHLMAALAGCGIHNALIELDGPEVPIFDGSSLKFARAFIAAGIEAQEEPVQTIRVIKPVSIEKDDAYASFEPHDGFEIEYSIEFEDAAIGRQALRRDLSNGAFLRELADCRTFVRRPDVDSLRAKGLALGGTMENAIVVEGDNILSPGGFRRSDECVRHKMLDAMGDLCLAGSPIIGRFRAHKAGHAMTNMLLRKLFSDKAAYSVELADPQTDLKLPGMQLKDRDVAAVV